MRRRFRCRLRASLGEQSGIGPREHALPAVPLPPGRWGPPQRSEAPGEPPSCPRVQSLALLRGPRGGAGAPGDSRRPWHGRRVIGACSAGTAGGRGRGCPLGLRSAPQPGRGQQGLEGLPGERRASEAPPPGCAPIPTAPAPRLRPLISGGRAGRTPPRAANYPPCRLLAPLGETKARGAGGRGRGREREEGARGARACRAAAAGAAVR